MPMFLGSPSGSLAQGKTKILYDAGNKNCFVTSKNDITAGDGAKHDSFDGKGRLSTTTTSNVFELLRICDVPVAYVEQSGPDVFLAPYCTMLPYEVIARRTALGSYLKRNPIAQHGQRFETLVVEFYLKTSGKSFGGIALPKDDPFIAEFLRDSIHVVRPDMPLGTGNETIEIPREKLGPSGGRLFADMEKVVRRVFLVLEKAWDLQGCTLCDIKVEFGFDRKGDLLVADVIDNDSWRLLNERGEHLDKQRYRDGATVEEVKALYEEVARRTEEFRHFRLRRPSILLWCGSESDDPVPFTKALAELAGPSVQLVPHIGSVHKQPERCLTRLRQTLALISGPKVLIAYVGRSNGAGPVFAAETDFPVIAVPASVRAFPSDVWSSLRMPSEVPLMTILDPANAVLAALGILGQSSPTAYAYRRFALEDARLDANNSPSFDAR